jgi:hypothetical protein
MCGVEFAKALVALSTPAPPSITLYLADVKAAVMI